jgi:hypothetical protein
MTKKPREMYPFHDGSAKARRHAMGRRNRLFGLVLAFGFSALFWLCFVVLPLWLHYSKGVGR